MRFKMLLVVHFFSKGFFLPIFLTSFRKLQAYFRSLPSSNFWPSFDPEIWWKVINDFGISAQNHSDVPITKSKLKNR